ncbi:MAG: NADH-quinone oxidoreductase subunit D [Nitrospirae bacterium]|nr:NADH-quinone oxidoreductase subunit D [Nitrospirota bacterium]
MEQAEKIFETRELNVNMGPQHPATHGVLRLVLEIDGETIVKVTPYVGYLHRGIEKLGESLSYFQALPLTDRMDYVSAMSNNIGYCVAVEKLFGIEAPERAKFIRTIVGEMSRISNHLLWLATHALDIGAMTVFLYCFREREWILELFEKICGARLTVTYPRIGGVRNDISKEFIDSLYKFTEEFPSRILEYETLIDQNRIWLKRTVGIGVISAEEAVNWGLTGPTLRGSGVAYDVRKFAPYDAYDKIEFEVPIGTAGDTYDRYRCRMLEMRQSNMIIRQCLDKLPPGPIMADAPKFVLQPKDAMMPVTNPNKQHAFFIEEKVCKGCGMCLRACPAKAITGEKKKPHKINQELCLSCMNCYVTCKFKALKIIPGGKGLSDEKLAELSSQPVPEEIKKATELLAEHFNYIKKGPRVPEGDVYVATEVPKGELGFYFVSDGSGKPYRMRVRAPSFVHAGVLPRLCVGHLVADVIANIGTIDIVLGECDR